MFFSYFTTQRERQSQGGLGAVEFCSGAYYAFFVSLGVSDWVVVEVIIALNTAFLEMGS